MEVFEESLIDLSSQLNLNLCFGWSFIYLQKLSKVWTSFWARSRTAHLPEDIQSNKYISLYDLENLIANLIEVFEESLIDLSSQLNLNLCFGWSFIYLQKLSKVWTSFWARSRTAHLPEDIQSNKYISLYDLENLIANLMEVFEESLIDLSSQLNLNLCFG